MLNQVNLIGNLGADPDIKAMQNGDKVANFSLATTEKWNDKNGERKEKTEWHRVVVWGKLVDVIEKYVKKGSKLYVSGKLQTRNWEQDGQKKYATEVVLQGFDSKLVMLDGRGGAEPTAHEQAKQNAYQPQEDEIPF